MLKKTLDKIERQNRSKQWVGLYPRKTKTRVEKKKQQSKKDFASIKKRFGV
jgi:hypothetical protein